MTLTLQQIIDEADILVPNVLETADKVTQLNSLNGDFFNIVKIPKIATFSGVVGQADYTLATDVREKNIDLVQFGLLTYLDLQSDGVNPTQNVWSFDDTTAKLTLSPVPYKPGALGKVRYRRIATSTFTASALTVSPDAPPEYHWTFVPALASWIAKSQDDLIKAATYEVEYKAGWNTAAQNYQKGAAR